jgi:hypothetical protein
MELDRGQRSTTLLQGAALASEPRSSATRPVELIWSRADRQSGPAGQWLIRHLSGVIDTWMVRQVTNYSNSFVSRGGARWAR